VLVNVTLLTYNYQYLGLLIDFISLARDGARANSKGIDWDAICRMPRFESQLLPGPTSPSLLLLTNGSIGFNHRALAPLQTRSLLPVLDLTLC
jgi:hypothetical protein